MTPYRKQKRIHFWRTAVKSDLTKTASNLYSPKFTLNSKMAIATAGSCFAQNIRNQLIKAKCNYIDCEPSPPLIPTETQRAFGYGLFSARFGNVYTVEQLNQLTQRAFGLFETDEPYWFKEGRVFDPLRPTIEPDGFRDIQEAISSRRSHLRRTRSMFETADCLIFTLGLTESWISRSDGTVFPLCPGVAAGEFEENKYEFKNTSVSENVRSFDAFYALIKQHNPGLKVILTVSPVALEATATQENVISATSHSKSILRATAGEISTKYEDVDYFPSYEIFTSPAFQSKFFKKDLRDPSPEGIAQAMDVFFSAHGLLETSSQPEDSGTLIDAAEKEAERFAQEQQAICDEMLLGAENNGL